MLLDLQSPDTMRDGSQPSCITLQEWSQIQTSSFLLCFTALTGALAQDVMGKIDASNAIFGYCDSGTKIDRDQGQSVYAVSS